MNEKIGINGINKKITKKKKNENEKNQENQEEQGLRNGNGLIEINSYSYLEKISVLVDRFKETTRSDEKQNIKNEFLEIIKELRNMAEDEYVNLSPEQKSGIINDIGVAFMPFDKLSALKYFKQAIVVAVDNDLSELIPIIDANLDYVHNEIDRASWKIVSQKWFKKDDNNKIFLDTDKLKINEINQLEISEGEFRLLERLCLKDDYSFEHSVRVSAISLRILEHLEKSGSLNINGKLIELGDEDKKIFARAALLHDVGKASKNKDDEDCISDDVLKAYYQRELPMDKKGVIQEHVVSGVKDLKILNINNNPNFERVIYILERHHKRLGGDGGYPKNIDFDPENKLDDALAEILALADTIEAMTSNERDYQKTKTLDDARKLFTKESVLLNGKKNEPLKNIFSFRMNSFIYSETFWNEIKEEFVEIDEVSGEVNEQLQNDLLELN